MEPRDMLGGGPDQTSSASTTLGLSSPPHLPFQPPASPTPGSSCLPAAPSLLSLGGGSEGRPQPEKEASGTLGTLPWVGGVFEFS